MTQISAVIDSTHSMQGRDGVDSTTKPKVVQAGQSEQVGGSELPAESVITATTEPEQMHQLSRDLNESPAMKEKHLSFQLSDDYPDPLLQVIDTDSGEVIRQIPGEAAIQIRERLAEGIEDFVYQSGLLFETDT